MHSLSPYLLASPYAGVCEALRFAFPILPLSPSSRLPKIHGISSITHKNNKSSREKDGQCSSHEAVTAVC